MTVEQLEEHLARNSRSVLFARLADMYRRNGRTDDALRLCHEGLRFFSDYPTARIVAARCLAERNDLAGALSHLDVALGRYPDNAVLTAMYNEWVKRIVTSQPESQRGLQQPKPSEAPVSADTSGEAADSVLGDVPIVSVTLAEIYTMQGAYEAAVAMYRKLQQQKPHQAMQFETKIQELKKKISQDGRNL